MRPCASQLGGNVKTENGRGSVKGGKRGVLKLFLSQNADLHGCLT